MPIEIHNGEIQLPSACVPDDAEALLTALGEHPELVVNVQGVAAMHTAVLQVLLASEAAIKGEFANEALRKFVAPKLSLMQ